jgi:hypothetical protein
MKENKKLEKLSVEQQQRLNKLCKDNVDFILHSGKDLTEKEVEPYIEWIYKKIGKPKPEIKIFDSFLAQRIAIDMKNKEEPRETNINSLIDSQISSQIRSQIRSQVSLWVSPQVLLQVSSRVISRVSLRVGLHVNSQLESQISSRVLEFVERMYGLNYESYWLTLAEFWKSEGIFKNDDFDKYLNLYKCGIWSICYFENAVFICKLPIKVLKDDKSKLHSVTQAAVQWRDGLDNYFIHGVGFERELWKKVVKRELTPQELLQIKNIDQRFAALNHYGFENVLEQLNSKLIDKSQRGNELYSMKFDRHMLKFLKYIDTVNGTPRISFVKPEFDDADAAMAWKHNMTKEEYQNKLRIEA